MTSTDVPEKTHAQKLRKRPLPSIDELQRLFRYDPATGHILHQTGTPLAGQRADFPRAEGYLSVALPGQTNHYLLSHRVAFAIQTKRWPNIVDHINRNRADNRWQNLREATHSENMRNKNRAQEPVEYPDQPKTADHHWPGTPHLTSTPEPIDTKSHGTSRKNALPSIEALRTKYAYDPATGEIWHRRYYRTAPHKRRADWLNDHSGYRIVSSRGTGIMRAHRLAFALMTGRWPHLIDHLNRNRSDNRWVNLRETTQKENIANSRVATLWGKHIYRNKPRGWFVQMGKITERRRIYCKTFCAAVRIRHEQLQNHAQRKDRIPALLQPANADTPPMFPEHQEATHDAMKQLNPLLAKLDAGTITKDEEAQLAALYADPASWTSPTPEAPV